MIQQTTSKKLHARLNSNAQFGSNVQSSLNTLSGLNAQTGLDARPGLNARAGLDVRHGSDLALKLLVLVYLFEAYQGTELSLQAIHYKQVYLFVTYALKLHNF